MRIKEGFILRNVGEQAVVVSVGEASKIFNGMIKLNSTGEFLWKHIVDDVSEEDLVAALLEEYDVEESVAKEDVTAFVEKLKTAGIVE